MVADLLRAQIEQVWGEGRVELVDELYAPGVVDHMPIPGQPGGREAMKDVVRLFRAAMPDLAMELHGVATQGDMGVDWWTLSGTHTGPLFGVPPTGRAVRFSGIDMARVAGGRIAELWHVEELLALAEQLGAALPAPPPPPAHVGPPAFAEDGLTERQRRLLQRSRLHIEEMWGKCRVELADELYRPDLVDHNPVPGQRPGLDGIIDVLTALHRAAHDVDMRVARYVVSGDTVVDRWTIEGTHTAAPFLGLPARGRRFRFHGMDVSTFDADERVAEVFHVEALHELSAQL